MVKVFVRIRNLEHIYTPIRSNHKPEQKKWSKKHGKIEIQFLEAPKTILKFRCKDIAKWFLEKNNLHNGLHFFFFFFLQHQILLSSAALKW